MTSHSEPDVEEQLTIMRRSMVPNHGASKLEHDSGRSYAYNRDLLLASQVIAHMRVSDERRRQDAKWGDQTHLPDGTGGATAYIDMMRAKVSCDSDFARGNGTWAAVLYEEVLEAFAETNADKLYDELIQVAAVASAWAEALIARRRDEHQGKADRTQRAGGRAVSSDRLDASGDSGGVGDASEAGSAGQAGR